MVKVRSNKVTKPKCCWSVLRHTFYGSFGMQNAIVAFIFKFDPRKRQFLVTQGQIRSSFKIPNFLTNICLSCAGLSKDSKNIIYFYVQQLKMLNIAFQKWDITFTSFLGPLHSQKQRYCFEILYACCLYVAPSHVLRFFG